MWTPEQDGRDIDPELIREISSRAHFLLDTAGKPQLVEWSTTAHHGVFPGLCYKFALLEIEKFDYRYMRVEAYGDDGWKRAYMEFNSEAEYINESLCREVVIPSMRRAMLLDDLANGSAYED